MDRLQASMDEQVAARVMTNNDVMGLSYLNRRWFVLICVDSCHCLRIRELGELASRQQSLQPKPNLLNRTQLFWDRIQVYARDVGRCFGCARYWPGSEVPPLLDLEILSIVRWNCPVLATNYHVAWHLPPPARSDPSLQTPSTTSTTATTATTAAGCPCCGSDNRADRLAMSYLIDNPWALIKNPARHCLGMRRVFIFRPAIPVLSTFLPYPWLSYPSSSIPSCPVANIYDTR